MSNSAHLWAIGYDSMNQASEVRDEIVRLRGPQQYLILLDVAVVVRRTDGSLAIERESLSTLGNTLGLGLVGILAALALSVPPLTGAAVGALLGAAGSAVANAAGIEDQFISEVEAAIKPGTSALFVLDQEGDMDVILHAIRGLGGTVLRTNVDLQRARLIQATLNSLPDSPLAVDTSASRV